MKSRFKKYTDTLAGKKYMLFDYDSTIAKVPVDWLQARVDCRASLIALLPDLTIPEIARVDEMEAIALRHSPDSKDSIFRFRFDLECALDGGHEELPEVCEFILDLAQTGEFRFFIVSNNLNRTVVSGLKQLGLSDVFEAILGVDDVGQPKPETGAFTMLQEFYGLSAGECVFIGDNDRTDGGFCGALGITFINITEN